MNYTLEDDIDFFHELNKALEEDNENLENSDDFCLISKQPLEKDWTIALECGHKFNYKILFNEIKQQKNKTSNTLESTKLYQWQLKCPYCRNIQDKILPFISGADGVNKINGVTRPEKYCMKVNKCNYFFKSGKRKGQFCSKNTLCHFCPLHNKKKSAKKIKQFNISEVDYNNLNNYLKNDLILLAKHLSLQKYSKLKKKDLIDYILKSKK